MRVCTAGVTQEACAVARVGPCCVARATPLRLARHRTRELAPALLAACQSRARWCSRVFWHVFLEHRPLV